MRRGGFLDHQLDDRDGRAELVEGTIEHRRLTAEDIRR